MSPRQRVIDISYRLGLSHIGSCLTALPIIEAVYELKKPNDSFILSSGHAALALYCVIEANGGRNAEEIFHHHGVHPDRCKDCGLEYSAGSLGQGLPAAVGMALADRSKQVYCLISDGECAEGSVFESLRIAGELELDNLTVLVNANGTSALGEIDVERLEWRIQAFMKGDYPRVSFVRTKTDTNIIKGIEGHYHKLTEDEWKELMK